MSGVLLELQSLNVGYGSRVLLDDVTAELCEGEFVGVLGANGAGKSTLLKVLSGNLAPQKGHVRISGEDVCAISRNRLARLVSVVNTERIEAEALTVREVVGMGRYPYTGFFGRLGSSDRRIVDEALEATGIRGFAGVNVASLSDGERQKAMIARALAQTTPVILLDEPTAFLDVASRVEVLSLLRDLAHEHGKGVLLSLHDVASALELSDRLWLIPGDGTLRVDTPENLVEAHRLGVEGNPLDMLFAGRKVRFDVARMDYRGVLHSSGCVYQRE